MATRFEALHNRRAIIDRRKLADALVELLPDSSDVSALRREATAMLKSALETGRREIAARLTANPTRGSETAAVHPTAAAIPPRPYAPGRRARPHPREQKPWCVILPLYTEWLRAELLEEFRERGVERIEFHRPIPVGLDRHVEAEPL